MKSASDCFKNAARCARQAAIVDDPADKTIFFGLATHWRTLANLAQRIDRGEIVGLPAIEEARSRPSPTKSKAD